MVTITDSTCTHAKVLTYDGAVYLTGRYFDLKLTPDEAKRLADGLRDAAIDIGDPPRPQTTNTAPATAGADAFPSQEDQ